MSDTPNNISKFLTAVGASIQSVEDALQQLYSERRVDTAIGAQLDIVGKVVGQPRGDLTDDELYRRYVRARIFTNRSNGTGEEIIKITKLVLNDDTVYIHVEQQQVATVVVDLRDVAVAYGVGQIVRNFLREGIAAGVKLVVEFLPQAAALTFSFAALGGGAGPGLGFSTFGTTDGGVWSAALE